MTRHSINRGKTHRRRKPKYRFSQKNTHGFMTKIAVVVGVTSALAVSVMGFMFANNSNNSDGAVTALAAEAVRSHILEETYINGIDVGGLTRHQALERLAALYTQDFSELNIVLNAGGEDALTINLAKLSPGLDFSAAVEHALSLEYAQRVTYPPTLSFDDSAVLPEIEEFLDSLARQPRNASSTREGSSFNVQEEVVGRSPDVPGTLEAFRRQLSTGQPGVVDVVFRELHPAVTAEDLRASQSLIGSFTTRITGSMDNPRNVNVLNAARHINGIVVQPGEIFSTNRNFGVMTYANGYRYAPIILNGQFVDGIGGGVCQISSTLYMALLFAEMEIVERRNHSLRVGYIDWAMDATLAGDWIDLRWRNNTSYPVTVEALVQNGDVIINIFGNESRASGRRLAFAPVHLENIPYGETLIEDPELPYGERVLESRGTTGQRWALYKTVFENDVQTDRYRVNTSTYRTVDAVVRVGTGASEPEDSGYPYPYDLQESQEEAPQQPTSEDSQALTPEEDVYVDGEILAPSLEDWGISSGSDYELNEDQ